MKKVFIGFLLLSILLASDIALAQLPPGIVKRFKVLKTYPFIEKACKGMMKPDQVIACSKDIGAVVYTDHAFSVHFQPEIPAASGGGASAAYIPGCDVDMPQVQCEAMTREIGPFPVIVMPAKVYDNPALLHQGLPHEFGHFFYMHNALVTVAKPDFIPKPDDLKGLPLPDNAIQSDISQQSIFGRAYAKNARAVNDYIQENKVPGFRWLYQYFSKPEERFAWYMGIRGLKAKNPTLTFESFFCSTYGSEIIREEVKKLAYEILGDASPTTYNPKTDCIRYEHAWVIQLYRAIWNMAVKNPKPSVPAKK